METLVSLPANAFEMICQRLLREAGFEEVIVTGRSGDGGIDGHGFLKVNPFVTFTVLFQCKRYQGSVPPSQVRDFRGAMMGGPIRASLSPRERLRAKPRKRRGVRACRQSN